MKPKKYSLSRFIHNEFMEREHVPLYKGAIIVSKGKPRSKRQSHNNNLISNEGSQGQDNDNNSVENGVLESGHNIKILENTDKKTTISGAMLSDSAKYKNPDKSITAIGSLYTKSKQLWNNHLKSKY